MSKSADREKRARKKRVFATSMILFLLAAIVVIFVFGGRIFGKLNNILENIPTNDVITISEGVDGKNFNQIRNLNIFNSEVHESKPVLYPGASGSYIFAVTNKTGTTVETELILSDINLHKVNMFYRVLIDDLFVAGSANVWLSMDDINKTPPFYNMLEVNSTSKITLEWHWKDASNDTEIAVKELATYILSIRVDASKLIK